MTNAQPASPVLTDCLHCGGPLGSGRNDGFCCRGCAAVYRLLHDAGLERYYDLGGGTGRPVVELESDRKWLEPIRDKLKASGGLTRVSLDVQGVHCTACVWLFDRLYERHAKGGNVVVNPAIGSVDFVAPPSFDLDAWVKDVEAFGYRCGPPLKSARAVGSDLVWRMGVSIAIAMNTMIFGVAIYCGLADGPVYRLFHALDFSLSLLSVIVGGTVFFRSAWAALRRRVMHLDLPIALGIITVFASSTYTYLTRGGSTSYFDTLNVFIALMLVGRFLQERVLAKNRALLLASDGAEGIYARRIDADGRVALVRCTEVALGDVLLVGHGDVVPVDATLLGTEREDFSLDWISGESAPRTFEPGDTVPAGAFARGQRACRVAATSGFESSALVTLLQTETRRDTDVARATTWHRQLTRFYVLGVLVLASAGFLGWLVATRDLTRTLDVVAAVLIVTCPCAFGIATPLAYELVQGRLRRAGLFVRTPGFLDRAAEIERVVFDKTGTLTTGRLTVTNEAALDRLGREELTRLYGLAVRSSHPKSKAVAAACEARGVDRFDAGVEVRELVGKGLELREGPHVYRLGSTAWATAPAEVPTIGGGADVVFTRDGSVLAALTTGEELRPDAREEVAELHARGLEVFLLSGDGEAATQRMAAAAGIPEAHAYAGRSPDGKARWLEARGSARTLFVGDGINDSLVAEAAYCSGTPAIDRPFMASRCDFYFVTPGLRPIRDALVAATRLRSVVRGNLAVALFYNMITVGLALAGLMTPLLCAVLMPLSSLSTVLATTTRLSSRTKR